MFNKTGSGLLADVTCGNRMGQLSQMSLEIEYPILTELFRCYLPRDYDISEETHVYLFSVRGKENNFTTSANLIIYKVDIWKDSARFIFIIGSILSGN